ncbi:MAG: TRAM domain-containing protein [Actinomycetota bacterium]
MTAEETVVVDKLVAGGEGLARFADGRIVFLPGVIAGESVRAEIVDSQRDFARARVVAIEAPSDKRREPPCPRVAEGCGGCDWQHIDRHAQGAFKRAIVTEAYARTGKMEIEPLMRRISDGARRTTVRVTSEGVG